MKQIANIFLLFVALMFCSCGDFFNFETEEPTVDGLRMSHHEVDLIVGDSITFDVELSPDTLPVSYYWQVKGNEDAIELAGRKVNALKEGQALVVVQAQRVSNEAVDVVVRPEDVDVVPVSQGMLTGTVTSVTFKGVHYEMIIDGVDHKWTVHSTKAETPGSMVGLAFDPFDIHIMKKSEE